MKMFTRQDLLSVNCLEDVEWREAFIILCEAGLKISKSCLYKKGFEHYYAEEISFKAFQSWKDALRSRWLALKSGYVVLDYANCKRYTLSCADMSSLEAFRMSLEMGMFSFRFVPHPYELL